MDDTAAATKGDVRVLGQRIEKIEERLDRIHEGVDQVLAVLINVEKKLTVRLDDHEERLIVLERAAA
jgi:hypothetical protein